MKLTVVTCDCHQTLPHRKFKAENGGKSDGFFSLAEGKYILETLKDQGHLNEAEFAARNQELTASGLPEFTIYGDAELDVLARNSSLMFRRRSSPATCPTSPERSDSPRRRPSSYGRICISRRPPKPPT